VQRRLSPIRDDQPRLDLVTVDEMVVRIVRHNDRGLPIVVNVVSLDITVSPVAVHASQSMLVDSTHSEPTGPSSV
jgi:hypothetical protein